MSKPQLTIQDFSHIAIYLNADINAVRALAQVESNGAGFLLDDRPKVLFERHIMFRELSNNIGAGRASELSCSHPDIVNPAVGGYAKGATPDLRGQAEWMRLAAAIELDRNSALQSASWGMFQIMGFHWRRLGFANVQAFVNAQFSGEPAQLSAFAEFIRTDPPLHRALVALDWATVAKRYNGADYAKNKYDTKLAAAFDTFRKELP